MDLDQPIIRQVTKTAYSRTKEEPVILLEGPRSSGKSTTLRALADKFETQVLDFDNSVIRETAERDPDLYIQDKQEGVPIFIDEYQRVPAILDTIKLRMNRSSRSGQFVITGSTRHNARSGSVQALTGRLHRMRIFPFAQSEMEGTSPNLLSRIFADAETFTGAERTRPAGETREGYIERIVKGGFPLAVNRNVQARNRWFDDYLRQTIERDIPGLAKIRNSRGLSALLRKLAAQSAQILTLEKIASGAALDIATARDYVQLLEDVFMVYKLEAWGRTLGSRVAAKPKIHILDSGIAARLLGISAEKLASGDPSSLTEFGHLLETFAVSELFKELSWIDDTILTGHWHTHDDKEVDLVMELMDGSVYGFEIKASGRALDRDFEGLAALKKFAGDSFKAGFVLYTGNFAFKFAGSLYALPIAKIWESPASSAD
jgi:predicted AAA+ superfamily ATPase